MANPPKFALAKISCYMYMVCDIEIIIGVPEHVRVFPPEEPAIDNYGIKVQSLYEGPLKIRIPH